MKNLIKKIRQPKVFQPLIIILVALLVFGGVLFYEHRTGRVSIDTSIVSAPIIAVSPTTPGKLTELDVYEGQQVKKGDVLAMVGSQTLRADTDGVIVTANNQVGGLTSATNPVIQLVRLEDMRVAGTIDENKGLNGIHIGQAASFTVDALPGKTFWGYVDEISPSAKQTALSFSISSERPTQQFVIYVRYDALKYPAIKNGMSAKLTVFTKTQ